MSWVEWQGETLPKTRDIARLRLTVEAADVGGPRQSWRFELGHLVPNQNRASDDWRHVQTLNVSIAEMGIQVRDWRELAGLTIRTTPQWLAQVETCGPYAQLVDPLMEISHTKTAAGIREWELYERWTSIEYELRFGQWDDGCLACELDAWAVPSEEYHRTVPETPEELGRFAVGPPNLRVITRAAFDGGRIEMERCGDDPTPMALQRLREQVGEVEVVNTQVHWPPRYANGPANPPVKEPGWRGKVSFSTGW